MSDFVNRVTEMVGEIGSIPPRQETLSHCIERKLLHSDDMYNSQVMEAYNYLLSRDNLKVIRTIAKENKRKEKLERGV